MGIYLNPGNEEFQKALNSKIYVDLFPCNECAKEIIQAGIKEVAKAMKEKKYSIDEIMQITKLSKKEIEEL